MISGEKLYIISQRAVPEVLLKVVQAKKLLASDQVFTVQEATDEVGISRSSFYKYKDDIQQYYNNARGKTVTLMVQMDDQPGVLSNLLNRMAEAGLNILTIHQSIPVNGVASVSLSVESANTDIEITGMTKELEIQKGIQYIKILAME